MGAVAIAKKALWIASWTLAILLLLIAGLLGSSVIAYYAEMRIPSTGISEAGYVRIGGIAQWVQIRGDDRRNPVLLWLNGGPGFSTIPSTWLTRPWERDFTVVMWDQRGEGRTFTKAGPAGTGTMSIDRMTRDGLELADYLRAHLHQRKIVLLGHSWGSILGIAMAQAQPEFFAAYVGTGQVTNMAQSAARSYPRLIARARSRGNLVAERQLAALGPPPYKTMAQSRVWLRWANALDPGERALPRDWATLWAFVVNIWGDSQISPGARYSQETMLPAVMQVDLPSRYKRFDLPVLMMQGDEDLIADSGLARDYLQHLEAPAKAFVPIPAYGHMAIGRDRSAFLATLVAHLKPWIGRPDWPARD